MKSNRIILALALYLGVFIGFFGNPSQSVSAEGTTLPLPRFVSLRADQVNLRTGPGVQFPVEWVYQRQNLPVEIIAEYRTWRKIRDWQSTQGWVHQSMLSGRRSVIVTGKRRSLRSSADTKSPPVAEIEAGAIAHLDKCPSGGGWCFVEAESLKGWLRKVEFWGAYRDEVLK
jgi:SH3-like domain-containing protein